MKVDKKLSSPGALPVPDPHYRLAILRLVAKILDLPLFPKQQRVKFSRTQGQRS